MRFDKVTRVLQGEWMSTSTQKPRSRIAWSGVETGDEVMSERSDYPSNYDFDRLFGQSRGSYSSESGMVGQSLSASGQLAALNEGWGYRATPLPGFEAPGSIHVAVAPVGTLAQEPLVSRATSSMAERNGVPARPARPAGQ